MGLDIIFIRISNLGEIEFAKIPPIRQRSLVYLARDSACSVKYLRC